MTKLFNCHKPRHDKKDGQNIIRLKKSRNNKNKDYKKKCNYCKINKYKKKYFYRKKKAGKKSSNNVT